MDFSLDEEQEAVRDLAAHIFEDQATPERVKEVEGGSDRFDRTLWAELAKSNLLGICLPEDVGGSGFAIIELCLLLEQQGRRVAPVPLLSTVVGAMAIAEFGTPDQRDQLLPDVVAGDAVLGLGLSDEDRPRATPSNGSWRLDGTSPAVLGAHLARVLVLRAATSDGDVGLFLVDPGAAGVELVRAETTNREIQPHVLLQNAPADRLGGPEAVEWAVARALVGLCAIQVGITEEAVRLAAAYTSERQQFGRALATFQGVALRAADAYIDSEGIRLTLWQAAWALDAGLPASMEVAVAKFWAAEGGHRVAHAAQHVHGGVGIDLDYALARYFRWSKHLELALGAATAQTLRLGAGLAAEPA